MTSEEHRVALEAALISLLKADGHKLGTANVPSCSFTGCNCGGAEAHKIARADAIKLVREKML